MEYWLTVQETAEALQISARGMRKKIVDKSIPPHWLRQVQGRGGKSGLGYEINWYWLESQNLDVAVQVFGEKIGDKYDPNTARRHNITNLEGLSAWQLEAANERMKHIEVIEKIKLKPENRCRFISALQEYSKKCNISPATLRGWYALYNIEGFRGLAPKHGQNKGKFLSLPREIQAELYHYYAAPQQRTIQQTWECAAQLCDEAGIPRPSCSTIGNFIKGIPESVLTFKRLGLDAWKQRHEPIILRDNNDYNPNELWVVDSREFDVFVYTDDTKARATRPWIVLVMDVGSRAFVGYRICWQPDSNQIALAYRDAFLRNGLPKCIYMDNGKDYVCSYLAGSRGGKRGKSSMNTETQSVLSSLRIDITRALPYNARAKIIEPAFRIFHRLERELPGWCGINNKNKPEKFKAELKNKQFLTFNKFLPEVTDHIEWYNSREHSELEATPAAVRANHSYVTIDEADIELLLNKQTEKKLHNAGIRIHNLWFWAEEFTEHAYIGEKFTVRYSPDDMTFLRVYRDNTFFCIAHPVIKLPPNTEEKVIKQANSRRHKALKNVKNFPLEKEIAGSFDRALTTVISEKPREPVVNPLERQGTITEMPHKKIIAATFKRLEEKGVDIFSPNNSLGVPSAPPNGKRPAGPAPERPLFDDELMNTLSRLKAVPLENKPEPAMMDSQDALTIMRNLRESLDG